MNDSGSVRIAPDLLETTGKKKKEKAGLPGFTAFLSLGFDNGTEKVSMKSVVLCQ